MRKSLLDIVKQVAGELSFTIPPSVLSSSDTLTSQIKYLVQNACEELHVMHDWQALLRVQTLTLTGAGEYALPTDLNRIVPNSFVHNASSGNTNIVGSTSPQYFQTVSTNGMLAANQITFQVFGNKLKVYPESLTGTLTFIYVTNNFIINSAGTVWRSSFAEDGDFPIFDSRLLTNLVKMKLLATKGLDNSAATADYNSMIEIFKSTDVPAPILSLDDYPTGNHTYTAINDGFGGIIHV